jgi:hypothetical protein
MAKTSRKIGNADLLALDVRIHSQNATKDPNPLFVYTQLCAYTKRCA